MVITIPSSHPLETVCAALEKAVPNHRFGIIGQHDMKETMARKGVNFERECRVYEVCNPHQAKKILDTNMEVSTALPCRISVYPEGDQVILATMKPTAMLGMFDVEGVKEVAQEVEETMMAIMQEAAGNA